MTHQTPVIVLLLAALLGAVGCGHPLQRRLEGRWFGESVENVESEQLAMVTGWVKGMSMEFAGDQLTVMVPLEEPRTGKYEVVHARENDITLAVSGAEGRIDTAHFILDDTDSIRMKLGRGRTMVLRRE